MKRTEGVPKSLPTLTRCPARKAASEKCLWNPEGRVGRDLAERRPAALAAQEARSSRSNAERHCKNSATVQVDTLSINVHPDTAIKHFTAYDPVSRFTAAKAFGRATATCSADFLSKLTRDHPFKVEGIQVDGGSEFMTEFETACQEKGRTLSQRRDLQRVAI